LHAISDLIAPFDRVVVACSYEKRPTWATILRGHDVGGEILLDRDLLVGAVAVGQCGAEDTLVLSRGPIHLIIRVQKRKFDLIVSLLLLVILAPLLVGVACALKIEKSGPVFFKQTRVGLGNRQFAIFKFRSMRQDQADEHGTRSAGRADQRITRVGRFIRRTSIDELPQLINVLRGDMSIVGPRPHALGSLAGDRLFWEATDAYWLRHALKPGITGLAQVRGFRGATHYPDDVRQRVRADLEYLTNWSLWGDVMILLKTLRVVVHENAY
jgi:lipopolysaccharide/colanic/teichoic acid biosynthesis glycosyltransferase